VADGDTLGGDDPEELDGDGAADGDGDGVGVGEGVGGCPCEVPDQDTLMICAPGMPWSM
jgi:hypothetical protein